MVYQGTERETNNQIGGFLIPINSSWQPIKLDVLRVLYTDFELTQQELCKIFGHDVKTLRKQLLKMGILRDWSDVIKLNWKHGKMNPNHDSVPRGDKSLLWKGGRFKSSKGYIMVYAPNNPLSENNGYIREHRLVWFTYNPLTPKDWVIHHLNGIKDDNRIENLFACSRTRHLKDFPNTFIEALRKRIRELEGELIRQ